MGRPAPLSDTIPPGGAIAKRGMGQVTATYLRKVVAAVVDPPERAAVLRSAGIDPAAPPDAGRMIDADTYHRLLERVARDLPDASDMPLRVGAAMRCDDYGAFGLAWKTAPTLRGSLLRAVRYWRVLTSTAQFDLLPAGRGDAWFVLRRAGPRRLGLRLSNEATLAASLAIMREVAPGPVRPTELRLRHRLPERGRVHAAWFGCPVLCDADRDGLRLPAAVLDRPNRLGDAGLSRYLAGQLDGSLAEVAPLATLADTVRRQIEGALGEGVPGLAGIAASMGLSDRGLQRRLAAEGLSFRSLLDQVRREVAEGLLLHSDHALAEIAFLSGFSEQSALTRAFRRWHGVPPAAYRQRQRAPRAR